MSRSRSVPGTLPGRSLLRAAAAAGITGLLGAGCTAVASTAKPSSSATSEAAAAARSHGARPKLSAGATTSYQLSVGGLSRSFLVRMPDPIPSGPMPLVLMYHGAEGTASGLETQTNLDQVADQDGLLAAYLQGYDDTWNEDAGDTPARQAGANDVAFTRAVIASIESNYDVDRSKIAAVGISNGALMVEDLGCKLANELTVIVPVEGELPVSVSSTCKPSRPISVFEIHGTADASIPYGGGPFAGVGGGTTVLSAPGSVARWAKLDRCSAQAPDQKRQQDGMDEVLSGYRGCRDDAHVQLLTIDGGTHNWPSNLGQLVAGALSGSPATGSAAAGTSSASSTTSTSS